MPTDEELMASLDASDIEKARRNFSVVKSRWRSKLKNLDTRIQNLINDDRRGDLNTPIITYKDMARRICQFGLRGEKLLDRAVNLGMGQDAIGDLRDMLGLCDMWSSRIVKIMKIKWGETPAGWPIYICDVAQTQELADRSASIKALDRMLED